MVDIAIIAGVFKVLKLKTFGGLFSMVRGQKNSRCQISFAFGLMVGWVKKWIATRVLYLSALMMENSIIGYTLGYRLSKFCGLDCFKWTDRSKIYFYGF